MLKYKLQRIVEVDDFDSLVTKTYGKPYSFQQQDGCKDRGTHYISVPSKYADDFENDTLPFEINGEEMGVSFATWLKTSVEDINSENKESYSGQNTLFWERNFYPDVDMLVNDMFEKGLIEEGSYIINIDW